MQNHNHQKKIALINDYTGFGRCSVSVQLPLISALKVQCCPLPTSVLSNHTGFDSFQFTDFTPYMQGYIDEWQKLGLEFSGICTGFLGSAAQIAIVREFIERFGGKNTITVIDPVMGDYGKTYSTYTPEMCEKMKELTAFANILTPNLTEACILLDEPYDEKIKAEKVEKYAAALSEQGPEKVVITGIRQGSYIANFCYEKGGAVHIIRTHKIGTSRSGTGDVFSAIVAADAVNGVEFSVSVRKASSFISRCIKKSIELDIPLTDGVCFEEVLHSLK